MCFWLYCFKYLFLPVFGSTMFGANTKECMYIFLALPRLLLKISRLLSHCMNICMCFLALPFLARIYVNEQINKMLCTKFRAKSAVLLNFYSYIIYISRLYFFVHGNNILKQRKLKVFCTLHIVIKTFWKNKNSQAVCNKIRTLIKLIVIFSFLTTFNNNYAKQCQNNIVLSLHMTECKINVRLYFYYFRFM